MTSKPQLNLFTVRRALDAVLEWHGSQTDRTDAPYLGHLLQVAGLAAKYRPGDSTVVVAALLHDAIEDADVTEAEIEARFGLEVAEIVRACSDSVGGARDATDWCRRKRRYLEHLPEQSDEAMFVSLCDKVANARQLALDLLVSDDPREFFRQFNQPDPAVQLWYYSELTKVFEKRTPAGADRLVRELRRAVDAMHERLEVDPESCTEAAPGD